MKTILAPFVLALAAQRVAGHAIFQALWVNGVDKQSTCLRMPQGNSPVTDVSSSNIRCNVNTGAVAGKCPVVAGQTVTVEMHQQPNDRSCGSEAIGGAHYGPVIVYLSKVSDASTADGSAGWFKIFQDTWTKVAGSGSGDGDNWGVKDLNTCCGRMNVKIPADIPAGDYLLRAEVVALHTAGSPGGAQFYMSCYQLTVTGGGSANPATVLFPGAYSASDPGILINIHAALNTYIAPGPTVYAGGSTKVAGAGCAGVETGTATGPAAPAPTTTKASTPSTLSTSRGSATTSSPPSSGCTVARYGQCGGNGYTGCTTCASGLTCNAVSPPFYSQCQ